MFGSVPRDGMSRKISKIGAAEQKRFEVAMFWRELVKPDVDKLSSIEVEELIVIVRNSKYNVI